MPFGVEKGSLIDLEAARLCKVAAIAEERMGRRPTPATVWRWINRGSRGVRLEAVLVGGAWHTTKEAFAAFVRGQTAAAMSSSDRHAATKAALDAVGLG